MSTLDGRGGTAHTLLTMTHVPQRWQQLALVALGLVGGPVALFSGVRLLDRGSTIAGAFLVVGGVLMVLGGGLTLLGLLPKEAP